MTTKVKVENQVENQVVQAEIIAELNSRLSELRKNLFITIEIITPLIAKHLLEENLSTTAIKNRKISNRKIKQYVRDILGDFWKVAAPIIIDKDGKLIDGQNRCLAVIRANHPIISIIIRGSESDVFDVLDNGKSRTHADALSSIRVNGQSLVKHSSVSAAINAIKSYNQNHSNIKDNRGMFTNPEIVKMVRDNFHFYDTPFRNNLIQQSRKNLKSTVREGVLAAFYYMFKPTDTNVDNFMRILSTNDSTTPNVIRSFREVLLQNKNKKSTDRSFLSEKDILVIIIKLYMIYKDGNLDTRKTIPSATDKK